MGPGVRALTAAQAVKALPSAVGCESRLDPDDAAVAQGLADVAAIGILHERAMRESDIARQQLESALDSRVVIEQAKGVIAVVDNVDIDEAFARLRERARSSRRKLSDVAREVIDEASRR